MQLLCNKKKSISLHYVLQHTVHLSHKGQLVTDTLFQNAINSTVSAPFVAEVYCPQAVLSVVFMLEALCKHQLQARWHIRLIQNVHMLKRTH